MVDSFPITRWSVVYDAGRQEDISLTRNAMATLYRAYWPPLYAYVRRQGHNPNEAEDLIQSFFMHVMEDDCLRNVSRKQGRFRAFLLVCLKNFLSDHYRRRAAVKRGSGQPDFSLDFAAAEHHLGLEPRTNITPEDLFERRWASIILDRAMARLAAYYAKRKESERFECLKGYLNQDQETLGYRQAAEVLGISEDAFRQAVRRIRQHFGRCLRAEISLTVATKKDIDGEIRYLLNTLRK